MGYNILDEVNSLDTVEEFDTTNICTLTENEEGDTDIEVWDMDALFQYLKDSGMWLTMSQEEQDRVREDFPEYFDALGNPVWPFDNR